MTDPQLKRQWSFHDSSFVMQAGIAVDVIAVSRWWVSFPSGENARDVGHGDDTLDQN